MAELGNGWTGCQVLADSRDSPGQPSEWWTVERAALHRWLERKAPGLAPIYKAGVLMAMDPSFPGRVRFVAHAIRELQNRLPDAVAGEIASTRTEYRDLAEQIRVQWVNADLPSDGSIPSPVSSAFPISGAGRYEVSAELLMAVAKLVVGHISIKGRKKENARRLFEAIGGPDPPSYVVQNWWNITEDVHRFAHVSNNRLPPEAEDEMTVMFMAFEASLLVISKRSYENLDVLDQLLKDANAR